VEDSSDGSPASGAPQLNLVAPGSLDRPTGGDRYDARMVAGLRDRGWLVSVHGLEGDFPRWDGGARKALDSVLGEVRDGSRVLVDGLILGGLPDPVQGHADRLRILALVHHPLADETGLDEATREQLVRAERRALQAARGVVVTSRHTARRVEDLFGVSGDRIRVAIPGTDPAPPAEGPTGEEVPTLLCVGSVIRRKGHDVLVAALERLPELPWRLVCVGSLTADPNYADDVQRSARDAGLADRIHFSGTLSDERLERMFHSSSLFVLPSHYEGYGMSLAEAMVRGLPIVSTTGGAIPETVPPDAGILVTPGNSRALASALETLLGPEGADRRNALARACRARGRQLPTWDEAAGTLERAILELTGPDEPDGGVG